MKMIEGMSYQKEKRKKRLTQKNRKKIDANQKYEDSKRHQRPFSYEDHYFDIREWNNSG